MSNQLLKTSKNSPERAINRPKQDLIFLGKHQKSSGLIAPAALIDRKWVMANPCSLIPNIESPIDAPFLCSTSRDHYD